MSLERLDDIGPELTEDERHYAEQRLLAAAFAHNPSPMTWAALCRCVRNDPEYRGVPEMIGTLTPEQVIELARNVHGSNSVNIDDDAMFSVGDDGVWVGGWLFVAKDQIPGFDDEEDVADEEPDDPEPAVDPLVLQAINRLDRADIVRLLEAASIQCYDEESLEVLREALRSNVADGTIHGDHVLELDTR